ncbi:hypothetical protein [Sphingobium sp. DC-2]|uniref:hypothetical protein n=1 Tax=Sphingobium sp. DC-2 TaxID=1303256 RepID=UPI0004C339A3|nr:hypothetical protein [Sphingobium sp. DC-2]
MTTLIDVWNLDTFDAALMGELRDQQQLLIDYFATDRTNYLEREASDHRGPKPSNPHASAYYRFAEDLMAVTQTRTIRAWHHTRMTDREVETATSNGLYPATVETLRARLADRVADGDFSADEARVIFEASPFHNDQLGSRGGKFWMTSHPHRIDDSGVTSLLAHWGGESAYFNHDEGEILDRLSNLGSPRVLEIAVPLSVTPDAYSAATAVIALYARSLNCHADWGGFDLYASSHLGPEALLRVHSGGEPDFATLGRGYPAAFHDRFGDDA